MKQNIEQSSFSHLLAGVFAKNVKLSEFSFLDPIAIAHLAICCKEDSSILNMNECSGQVASFLSRLGFFNYIGMNDPIGNSIYAGNNVNTIEVSEANNSNSSLYDQMLELLKDESIESRETIERLVSELITNTEMYAIHGVVVGQVIARTLHLAFVDFGPGIAKQLKTSSEYSGLSDDEALVTALKKGVTSGQGKGFGLWQTQEVLKKNNGLLKIRTGNRVLDGLTGDFFLSHYIWLGTSVELRYNLDNPIDFSSLIVDQDSVGAADEFGF